MLHLFQQLVIAAPDIRERPQHINIHRLNDEAVVVIPAEFRAVAVHAIAQIPAFKHVHSIIHARQVVVAFAHHTQRRLHHCGEEEPVHHKRGEFPRRAQGTHQIPLRLLIQRVEQLLWGANDAVRQERRVHQRLPIPFGEVHEVRRFRIYRVCNRLAGQLTVFRLNLRFFARQGIQFQPRRNAADRPSERFEVHILHPFRMEHRRHVLLQRPRRQVFQHRISNFQHCLQPIRSCFHLIRLPCRIRRLPIRSVQGMPTGRRFSASAPAASSAPCVSPAG